MNSQHMLSKESVNHLYTTKTGNILQSASHVLHNPRRQVSSIRIAWIRDHQHDRADISTTKSDQLIRKFLEKGLDIWILDTKTMSPENISRIEISCFDFILLEYSGSSNAIEETLRLLRKRKHVPLVILADEQLVECSLDLIEKGADAFFLTTVDNEVILAHCQALLRRCYDVV